MEDAKKAIANEREADFSYLHWDDVETLKSYLTPEQLSLLDQPLLPQPKFVQESREKLDTMVSCMVQPQGQCDMLLEKNYVQNINSVIINNKNKPKASTKTKRTT